MMGSFMRSFILAAMVVLLIFLCVACVPDNDVSLDGNIYSGISGRINIGVTVSAFDDSSITGDRNRIQSYFEEISTGDVEFYTNIQDGKRSAEEQLHHIETFIAEKYDVMIIDLVDASLAGTILEKAKAAGIPVVFLRRQPEEYAMKAWDKTCFVGFDISRSGLVQGEIVASLPNNGDIDGDGVVRYVMITGNPEYPDAQYRTEYSIKALTDRGIEVEELVNQNGDWDQDRGYDIAVAAIAQFGDKIDVIFCNNDYMAIGASQAITEAGRTVNKDIYLVGWDAMIEAVDMVNSGLMTGTVSIDNDSRAVAAANAAIRYVQGKKNERYIWIDYVPITSEVE